MQAIRLREVRNAAPHDGQVIDVSFSVVRERKILRAIRRACVAVLGAAALGFMIPPLWLLAQQIWPMLGAN
ncbi:MAG: hypothetical protein QM759_14805 [Terricaulis sp.]